mmetsp:Transcript_14750/g.24012  ORF Transcript_14750/g.24012 Transcript_14750/m.24012 type:complete len:112 (+) Transcript_14750:223-558(+)
MMDALPPNLKLKILSALNVDVVDAASSQSPSQKIPKIFELSQLDEKQLKILTKRDLEKLNEYGYVIKNGFLGDLQKVYAYSPCILLLYINGCLFRWKDVERLSLDLRENLF